MDFFTILVCKTNHNFHYNYRYPEPPLKSYLCLRSSEPERISSHWKGSSAPNLPRTWRVFSFISWLSLSICRQFMSNCRRPLWFLYGWITYEWYSDNSPRHFSVERRFDGVLVDSYRDFQIGALFPIRRFYKPIRMQDLENFQIFLREKEWLYQKYQSYNHDQ